MKVFSLKKEHLLIGLYLAIIAVCLVKSYMEESIETFSMPVSKKVIMIDSGHGGWDPGKVSSDNTLEKDINLAIAQKLQMYLEQGGSTVLVSRISDEALSNKKKEDLKNRAEMANTGKADILISIHQNSYPSQDVKGAQVFYYGDSEQSKTLAEKIQAEIKNFVDESNNRVSKPNNAYYILKQTKIPAVIVECGFLSSDSERKKLLDEDYQEKIAWGIYMGIVNYCKEPDGGI